MKFCASTTFEVLLLSNWTLCQQKSYVSKGIQSIFEIFPSARRCWGWASGWKVSGAQVFYLCNGKVKTLRIDNIWNFATFNLYSVPEKILYLQRYSTDFRNLCLHSKMLRVAIWVENFRCGGISLFQWQGGNFAHRQHLKFCYFQPVHCASKNPISPKVFNRFSKSFRQLEDVEGGHLGESFRSAGIVLLQRQGENFAHRQHLKFCTFNLYTVQAEILYLQRYSTDCRNLSLSSKMLTVAIWVESFMCAGILLLQLQGENFAHRQHLKFCHFHAVHCASRNPISLKVFNRFSKSSPQARRYWGWAFGWKV